MHREEKCYNILQNSWQIRISLELFTIIADKEEEVFAALSEEIPSP